ncbi:hypothetical protein GH714_027105 [Hevea brasiliensis]|uniref:Uncharacterized protein n=1 Tax=Hevea brasiliensis TaxID=3981 RepID=A0A6A6LVC4_HEVBR|nr:hypothetical protein GH714_027105 [Hevea brasiliensis]
MESKPPQNPPRKVEDVDAQAMNLMKQLQERSMKAKPKAEKKVFYDMNSNLLIHKHCMILKMPLVFGAASTGLKSYGVPNVGTASNQNQGSAFNGMPYVDLVIYDFQLMKCSSDLHCPVFASSAYSSGLGEKEYAEPWYYYSYYSVTLPLRRPYAGHPAILDVEEFGEAYDENSINPAGDLGLMEEKIEPSMFFLQLPQIVPMIKRLATADDHEIKESSKPQ